MNGKQIDLKEIEGRIATLDRELRTLQKASVTGHGEIVNHGHRLEVDASLRLSNLLNRIKTAESSISTLQTNDDWTRDVGQGYIYPKTYTDYVSIGYSSKGAEILSVDGNIETLDGHYVKTDKIRARDGGGLLLQDDGGNGITITDGGAVTASGNMVVNGKLGVGIASPVCPLNIIQETDSQDNSNVENWGIIITNPQNDDNEEVGIGFRLSTFVADIVPGAGITHERTGGSSIGNLNFKTSPSTGVLTTWMTLDKDGNLGIGTTPTGAKLHVVNVGAQPTVKIERVAGRSSIVSGVSGFLMLDSSGASLRLNNYVTDNVLIAGGGGNVSIGTSTIGAKLSVNGGVHIGGTSDPGDNNLLVDGVLTANSLITASDIGIAADPDLIQLTGANTMLVNGTLGIGADVFPNYHFTVSVAAAAGLTAYTTYAVANVYSRHEMRKSHHDTMGTLTTTVDGETLGMFNMMGVDSGGNWGYGSYIKVIQNGIAGTRVPTDMFFETCSTNAVNTNQLILSTAGNIGINYDPWSAVQLYVRTDNGDTTKVNTIMAANESDGVTNVALYGYCFGGGGATNIGIRGYAVNATNNYCFQGDAGDLLMVAGDVIIASDTNGLVLGATQQMTAKFDGTDGEISTTTGDLYLKPNGNIKFGTYAAIVAETLQGYITIKDAAGNSRKLAVVA